MKVLIFEDSNWINLTPLSYIKPVFELRCGFSTLFDKIRCKVEKMEIGLWVREYLINLIKAKYNYPVNDESFFMDDLLLINSRWLVTSKDKIEIIDEGIYQSEGDFVYAVLKQGTVKKIWDGDIDRFISEIKNHVKKEEKNVRIIKYPWHFIHFNSEILQDDFEFIGKSGIKGKFHSNAIIYGDEKRVYTEKDSEVHPFVVLDTHAGPIYIDKKAKIFPNARIEGPCYIGEDTQIMPGANIREGNSFGPVCRIGGEVEESIFHSYSNKYHDGFIGHSYIGEFVNLGALTTNSDLKNDYSSVVVYVNGKPVDTGELKVGSFIGDHTKTSIGVFFNTGSSVGMMCNVTSGGILPKFFPSFIWYINGRYMKGLGIEMMLKTAKIAMERRGRTLSLEEEEVIRKVYEITEEQRKEYISKSRKIT